MFGASYEYEAPKRTTDLTLFVQIQMKYRSQSSVDTDTDTYWQPMELKRLTAEELKSISLLQSKIFKEGFLINDETRSYQVLAYFILK